MSRISHNSIYFSALHILKNALQIQDKNKKLIQRKAYILVSENSKMSSPVKQEVRVTVFFNDVRVIIHI